LWRRHAAARGGPCAVLTAHRRGPGGLTTTRYLLLLHVAGRPGREWASVGELAECLQASHHGSVALVGRCVALGVVECRSNAEDGRRVEVHLTPKRRRLVERIAGLHRDELQSFRDVFRIENVDEPATLVLVPCAIEIMDSARLRAVA
jgi:DNA-binding MarR family transcriptional regulator